MQIFSLARRLHVSSLLVGLLLLWQPLEVVHAAQADPAGTRLYTFGLHLFRLGEYYRAITELKRFTLLFPQHQRQPAAQLLIGLALQEDGLYDDAFTHFQRLGQTDGRNDVGRVAVFKLGELRFSQKHYPQAIEHFQHFLRLFHEGPLVARTIYLFSLAQALHNKPKEAQRILSTLPAHHALSSQARALQHALQKEPQRAPKSPQTAGLLAGILPGAGHLYLGKPRHAITAFLLNGLFLTGAVFAFHEGLEAVGAILLYFETGWYLGNINSAVQGARDTNRQQRLAFANHLRTTYAPPSLTLHHLQHPGLGLHLAF